jgi:hypothetical protein
MAGNRDLACAEAAVQKKAGEIETAKRKTAALLRMGDVPGMAISVGPSLLKGFGRNKYYSSPAAPDIAALSLLNVPFEDRCATSGEKMPGVSSLYSLDIVAGVIVAGVAGYSLPICWLR